MFILPYRDVACVTISNVHYTETRGGCGAAISGIFVTFQSLVSHTLRHRDTHMRILSILSQNERILTFNPAFALLL